MLCAKLIFGHYLIVITIDIIATSLFNHTGNLELISYQRETNEAINKLHNFILYP